MSLKVGQTLGQYKILDKLGAGGMGVVYRAQDTRLGRLVALKVLPQSGSEDEEAVERFRREARTASSLNHSNICTIYNFDEQDGQLFLSMELLDGETLDAKLSGQPLPPPLLLELATQIADALEAAHSDGILHRDIKPANIFLTRKGQVKILDFGLAKLAPGRGRRHPHDLHPTEQFTSQAGTTVGTISYMSPEQARGEDLDPRTDLFSFGVVLYEMATGRQSFQGATTAVVFDGILNRDPAPPSTFNGSIPAELDRIICKALEKDRDLRYQTAADMRADLQRLKRDSGTRRTAVAPMSLPDDASATVVLSGDHAAASGPNLAQLASRPVIAAAAVVITIVIGITAYTLVTNSGAPVAQGTTSAEPGSTGADPSATGAVSAVSGSPEGPAAATPGTPDAPAMSASGAPSDVKTSSTAAAAAAPSTPGAPGPATARAPAPKSGEAVAKERLEIAKAKLNSNLLEPALADLRQIFIDFPSSAAAAEASFLSAEILEKLGRLEDAMAAHIEFNKRFARDARLPSSKLRLAQLTLQSRQPERESAARRILADIVTTHPRTPQAMAALQMKLKLEMGRGPRELDPALGIPVPRALPTLRTMAEQFPESPLTMIALNRLAELYDDLGEYQRAAETYMTLATNFPANPNDAWFKAGELYERRLKDTEKARAAYGKVPESSSRYRDAQRKLK